MEGKGVSERSGLEKLVARGKGGKIEGEGKRRIGEGEIVVL